MQRLLLSSACTTLLITLPLCSHSTHYIPKYIQEQNHDQKDMSHTLVLWIHGTRFIKNHGFKSVFNKQSQLKNALALMQIRYYRRIIESLSENFLLKKENFYFFGWNGKLSHAERKKCASYLYNALKNLEKQYQKKHNIAPKIIIIGHSHGGNVILNMASYHSDQSALLLDKVVLLACPVQETMYHHLKSSLFKKIYVLYSYQDLIQRLAPNFLRTENFSFKNIKLFPFSKRLFPDQDNLTQARIIIDGDGPAHNDFVKSPFLSWLPSVLDHMETWDCALNQARYVAHISTK